MSEKKLKDRLEKVLVELSEIRATIQVNYKRGCPNLSADQLLLKLMDKFKINKKDGKSLDV